MTWLLTAWSWIRKAPAWLWAVLGAAAAIGWAFLSGQREGRQKAEQRQAERTIEQAQERREVEDEIQGSDPQRNRDRLRGWVPGSGD